MASNESSPQTTTPSPSSSNTVVNPLSSHNTLISINVAAQAPLKLTSSNYLSWRAQFESLLVGYDLMGYLDGTLTCPSPILKENGPETVNPSYSPWIRQDKLLLSAILALFLIQLSLLLLLPKLHEKHGPNLARCMPNHPVVVSWELKTNWQNSHRTLKV